MELSHAMKTLKRLPKNVVIQFPSGKWGFVGSVSVSLLYLLDGEIVSTDVQIAEVRKWHGVPFQKRLKTRVWDTKEDAERAALEIV